MPIRLQLPLLQSLGLTAVAAQHCDPTTAGTARSVTQAAWESGPDGLRSSFIVIIGSWPIISEPQGGKLIASISLSFRLDNK